MTDTKENNNKTVIITVIVEEKDGSGSKSIIIKGHVPYGIDTGKILANIRGRIVKKTFKPTTSEEEKDRERLDGY